MSQLEPSERKRKTVINNVRVFDGGGLIEPRTVVIDGSVIGNNPDGADEIVDGQGGVLLPGLIDAHVHLHHEGHLRELARYGVTTALDMATWPAEKMNGLRGKAGLPDVRSAGLPATAPGSMHTHILPLPDEALLSRPEEAERFVEGRIAEGSDYIKLISDVPGPTQETLDALVTAAHEKQKMTVTHASAHLPFTMALEAKTDVITHSPLDKSISDEVVEQMVADKIVSVPTLVMMREASKRPSLWAILGLLFKPSLLMAIWRAKGSGQGAHRYENARDSATAMYRGGVPILAGSDCHDEPNSPFEVKHGDSLHIELELLVEAGLSTVDALRGATILPAHHFGLSDRGAIEEGKRADLVLLRDDPTKDIRASRSIAHVWCGGNEFPISA